MTRAVQSFEAPEESEGDMDEAGYAFEDDD